MIKKDEICEAFTQMDSVVKNDSSALIEIPEDMTSEAPEAPEKKRKQSAAEELTNYKKSRDDTGNATSSNKAKVNYLKIPCSIPFNIGEQQQRQSDNHREIWKGELSWKNPKFDSNLGPLHTVVCKVTAQLNDKQETIVRSDNLPKKLTMQMIPKILLQQIESKNFHFAPSVLFHLNQSSYKDSLTQVLSQGYAGCVHFQSDKEKPCNVRVLVLLYNPDKNTYVGFIPNEQLQFVDCIRKVMLQSLSQMMNPGQSITIRNMPE